MGKKKKEGSKHPIAYDRKSLDGAVKAVRDRKMSVRKASRTFSIPKSTLYDKVTGRTPVFCSLGTKPILGMEGERRLVEYFVEMSQLGYIFQKPEVIKMGSELAVKQGKLDKYSQLGKEWYSAFVRRWPAMKGVVTRKPLKLGGDDRCLNFRGRLQGKEKITLEDEGTPEQAVEGEDSSSSPLFVSPNQACDNVTGDDNETEETCTLSSQDREMINSVVLEGDVPDAFHDVPGAENQPSSVCIDRTVARPPKRGKRQVRAKRKDDSHGQVRSDKNNTSADTCGAMNGGLVDGAGDKSSDISTSPARKARPKRSSFAKRKLLVKVEGTEENSLGKRRINGPSSSPDQISYTASLTSLNIDDSGENTFSLTDTPYSQGADSDNMARTNIEQVKKYYRQLNMLMSRHGLLDRPMLVYFVDEIYVTCATDKPRTLQSKSLAQKYNYPLVNVIGCGNAIGTALPPYFTFPDNEISTESLMENKLPGSQCTVTETGMSDFDNFKDYLEFHFCRYAQAGIGSYSPLLLLYDIKKSHVSPETIEWARAQNIIMCVIPPTVLPGTQCLDISCFKHFTSAFHVEMSLYKSHHKLDSISERDICPIVSEVYPEAFSSKHLVQAFRDSGVMPLNPDIYLSRSARVSHLEEESGRQLKRKQLLGMKNKGVQVSISETEFDVDVEESDLAAIDCSMTPEQLITDFLNVKKRQKLLLPKSQQPAVGPVPASRVEVRSAHGASIAQTQTAVDNLLQSMDTTVTGSLVSVSGQAMTSILPAQPSVRPAPSQPKTVPSQPKTIPAGSTSPYILQKIQQTQDKICYIVRQQPTVNVEADSSLSDNDLLRIIQISS